MTTPTVMLPRGGEWQVKELRKLITVARDVPRVQQPALFALVDDHKPQAQRSAADRYANPGLFD